MASVIGPRRREVRSGFVRSIGPEAVPTAVGGAVGLEADEDEVLEAGERVF